MQSHQTGKVADQYLLQRIEAASPEQLHAMLLEAGQKFLSLAIMAMNGNDIPGKSRHLSRVSDIIVELSGQLNRNDGGELVLNLSQIYTGWIDTLFDASQKKQPERLTIIVDQMAELRLTWEELHQKKTIAAQPGAARVSLDGLVG